MARRMIGQEGFSFAASDKTSDLDALSGLIDWHDAEVLLTPISDAAKGEQGWPPLCLLKAMLLARFERCETGRGAGRQGLVPALLWLLTQ